MRLNARVLLAVSATTLALGNVGRIPGGVLGGRNAPVGLNDLLLIPLWLLLFGVVFSGQRRWKLDSTVGWCAAFVTVAAISTMMAVPRYVLDVTQTFGVAAFLIRWLLYFGWYPFIVACFDADQIHSVWRRFDHAIMAIAIFGLFQTVFLPGFAQMIHTGGVGVPSWDIQGRRLVSTILDPNFAGILLVFPLLMRLARVAEGLRERKWPLLVLGAAALMTVSRSSLLAFAIGMLVIVSARGVSARLMKLFLAGAVVGLPFITVFLAFVSGFNKLRVDASAAQRLVPWIRAFGLVRDHPVLGVGFNAISYAQMDRGWRTYGGSDVSMDGGLLFVAAMTGVVGVLLYMGMLGSAVRRARKLWRDETAPGADRAFATGTAAITVAVVVHSFFVNSLMLPFVMQLMWILWGGVRVLQKSSMTAKHSRGAAERSRVVAASSRVTANGSRVAAVPALLAVVAVTACNPCAGSADCTTAPRVDVTGTIVDATTGNNSSNVRVTVTLANGTSKAVTTNSEGRWRIEIENAPSDVSKTSVTVAVAGSSGYTVPNVALTTRTLAGDAQDVGRWTSKATARFQVALAYRGKPLVGATVTFTPTAGVSAQALNAAGTSNGSGIFELDLEGPQLGVVVGTLHIVHPDVRRSDLNGFAIPLEYKYALPASRGDISIGGQVAYSGLVLFRGTDQRLAGVPVEFQRTGGVSTTEQVARATTGDGGYFRLDFTPLVQDITPLNGADVIGDLVIKPANRPETRYRGLHLAVYDSLFIRSLGLFAYGDRWQYAVELFDRGLLADAPNVSVEFRQTGGVPITPSDFVGKTDANGRFEMRAVTVRDTGTVTGDFIVSAPGKAPQTIRTLQLRTNSDDSLHFGGTLAIGERWAWAVELWRHDVLKPAPNVDVEFRQTSGLPITPSVMRLRTDASGRIELRSVVHDTGTVIGDLVVFPVGEAPRTISGLKLRTFAGDDLRSAGVFGFGPALRYVGEVLMQSGVPVVGASVVWTETSGIAASPATLSTTTDASGRFPLTLIPSQDGEVVGTVRVTPPAPYAAGTVFTFTNLRLNTFQSGDLVFAVTYRIPSP